MKKKIRKEISLFIPKWGPHRKVENSCGSHVFTVSGGFQRLLKIKVL